MPLSDTVRAQGSAPYFGQVIRRIEYRADQRLDRTRYDAVIGLKPGDLLTHTGLKEALQALYDTGRFSMIAADVAWEDPGVGLTFAFGIRYYRGEISRDVMEKQLMRRS